MVQTFGIACHRIMHDIGIVLQFWSCMTKAMSVAGHCVVDEVAVSTMIRYITQTMVAPYVPDINGGAVNNQHEDCLDLFGSEKEEEVPLTEAQLATYETLGKTLANFNDKNTNVVQ